MVDIISVVVIIESWKNWRAVEMKAFSTRKCDHYEDDDDIGGIWPLFSLATKTSSS